MGYPPWLYFRGTPAPSPGSGTYSSYNVTEKVTGKIGRTDVVVGFNFQQYRAVRKEGSPSRPLEGDDIETSRTLPGSNKTRTFLRGVGSDWVVTKVLLVHDNGVSHVSLTCVEYLFSSFLFQKKQTYKKISPPEKRKLITQEPGNKISVTHQ